MSRSGYSGDCDGWDLIRWRGAVKSALRGKRGQAFLRECLEALDALPDKRLESTVLVSDTGCCTMGAVALARGMDASTIDPYDREVVSDALDIAEAMAAEISYENDEGGLWRSRSETPEERFVRMRAWVESKIRKEKPK